MWYLHMNVYIYTCIIKHTHIYIYRYVILYYVYQNDIYEPISRHMLVTQKTWNSPAVEKPAGWYQADNGDYHACHGDLTCLETKRMAMDGGWGISVGFGYFFHWDLDIRKYELFDVDSITIYSIYMGMDIYIYLLYTISQYLLSSIICILGIQHSHGIDGPLK